MADCLVFSKLSKFPLEYKQLSTVLAQILGDEPETDYCASDWSSLEDYCLEAEDMEMLSVLLGFMVEENMPLYEVCKVMRDNRMVVQ